MAFAFDDVRVLDFSTSMAGAWCSRLLADFGADVVMVEPPGGHPLRRLAPFAPDRSSIPARYVQANKRSVALDLDTAQAREALADLVAGCDVVVESTIPGTLDGWGLGFEALEQLRPGLLLASITPHGQTGARARRPGNDLTAYARSGWASINGLATREPLKGSGFIASYLAGTAALGAVAAALLYRDLHGAGQHIDVAETEALLEIFGPGLLRGQYVGQAQGRRSGIDMVGTFPVPVRDGHMSIMLGRGDRWRHAMIALGLPEVADDDRYQSVESRAEERDQFSRMVESKMAEWDRMELFEALATLRVIAGPVLYVDELAQNEQLNAREYFARPPDATTGPAYPGAPVKMSATPWALRRSQPEVGAHTVEVLREVAGYSPERIDSLSGAGAAASS